MAREIKYIVIHCTAGPQNQTTSAIKNWWKKGLGWKSPGYHLLVSADGSYERLAEDHEICNGVAGQNKHSVHISYKGGVDDKGKALDNRTAAQKKTLLTLVREMKRRYPKARVVGHRDFQGVKKDCPSFNAMKEYENI